MISLAALLLASATPAEAQSSRTRSYLTVEIGRVARAEDPMFLSVGVSTHIAPFRDWRATTPRLPIDPVGGLEVRLDIWPTGGAQLVVEPLVGLAAGEWNLPCGSLGPNAYMVLHSGFATRSRGGPAWTFGTSLTVAHAVVHGRIRETGAIGLRKEPTREARSPGPIEDPTTAFGIGANLPAVLGCYG